MTFLYRNVTFTHPHVCFEAFYRRVVHIHTFINVITVFVTVIITSDFILYDRTIANYFKIGIFELTQNSTKT